ncbi:puratrophin-1 [Dryobates pubescens]|uniref:puratrophin-1 n=1 Tax=Dryobates pubescens TaxID=118200 RepID=UPI0023B987C8|nr:puratrophin-1 [Dryobates pubescens]
MEEEEEKKRCPCEAGGGQRRGQRLSAFSARQDSESLDGCIQSTLSALYPPFEATAATVLCQVFDVVEKTYRGDGLRYLIDFLIPAKHILQCIQQDACVQYCGLLFRHQGWPLCVHDKVVVQLAALDRRLLRPGDFYLQVVPYLKKSPRIVLKCLARDERSVEEVPIPEVSYTSIFTLEWLSAFNGERLGAALQNCLLTAAERIFRVPWDSLVRPEFIEEPEGLAAGSLPARPAGRGSRPCLPAGAAQGGSPGLGSGGLPHEKPSGDGPALGGTALVNGAPAGSVPQEDLRGDLEGEYVELAEVSLPGLGPRRASLPRPPALSYLPQPRAPVDVSPGLHSFLLAQDSPKSLAQAALMQEQHCQAESRPRESRPRESRPRESRPRESRPRESRPRESRPRESRPREANCGQLPLQTPPGALPWSCRHGSVLPARGRAAGTARCCRPGAELPARLGAAGTGQSCRPGSVLPARLGAAGPARCCRPGAELPARLGAAGPARCCRPGSVLPARGRAAGPARCCRPGSVLPARLGAAGPARCCRPGSVLPARGRAAGPARCCRPGSVLPARLGAAGPGQSCRPGSVLPARLGAAGPARCCRPGSVLPARLGAAGTGQSCRHGSVLPARGRAAGPARCCRPGSVLPARLGAAGPARCCRHGAELPARLGAAGTGQSCRPGSVLPARLGAAGTARCCRHGAELPARLGAAGTGQSCRPGSVLPARLGAAGPARCCRPGSVLPARLGAAGPARCCRPGAASLSRAQAAPPPALPPPGGQVVPASAADAAGPALRLPFDLRLRRGKGLAPDCQHPGVCLGLPGERWGRQGCGRARERLPSEAAAEPASAGAAPRGASAAAAPPAPPVPALAWGARCAPAIGRDVHPQVLRSGVACLPGEYLSRSLPARGAARSSLRAGAGGVEHEAVTAGSRLSLRLFTLPSSSPGTRDKSGRAVVIITTRSTAWLNPHCNTTELVRLLLYLHSIPRAECQALGLTVLVDARRCSPLPALFKAFSILQDLDPHCIHGVLLLVERDVTFRLEKPPAAQFEVLTSMKALHKHIDSSQLPLELEGSFPYCHRDWLSFRMKLEHLLQGCQGACAFLQGAIQRVEAGDLPARAEEAAVLLSSCRQLMKSVLEDSRLVRLQLEGGALLARLRKEESCVTLTQDYRDSLEAASLLYNRLDEDVHRLVLRCNQRLQRLQLLRDCQQVAQCLKEVSSWIETVGRRRLQETILDDSLEMLLQTQKRFREFDLVASEYCRRGQEALKRMAAWEDFPSGDVDSYRGQLQSHREQLEEFCTQLDETRHRLSETVRLYEFFDKAYEWALEGMRHLAGVSMEECGSAERCAAVLRCLQSYKGQHPDISDARFQEMKELACELKSDRGLKQWQFAWAKCQETKLVFEKKLEAALRTRRSLERGAAAGEQPGAAGEPRGAARRRHSEGAAPAAPWDRTSSAAGSPCHSRVPSASRSPKLPEEKPDLENILETLEVKPCCVPTPAPGRLPARRALRKAQSFDLPCGESLWPSCQRALSEPARYGNTGVFIKGLEVSSTELVDRTFALRQPAVHSWAADCLLEGQRGCPPAAEAKSWGSKLRHIIEEMVSTEREYVRSLCYIIDSYFPEMERPDLPQDLRGKRSVIFGNLEKLYGFHSQYFLRELESCCNHPLRVSHCFLRHKDQFGMYALYSKNKPKSDALLASHGNSFFKFKQVQLGDKMDLASYLLKPIQRMSKYALLLKDLTKACSEAQEQELGYLRAAQEMVKFQLRHGNDLLAMDAIRDCDVNLKEQGQLVRQDEFTVWLGRRKCQRHVFLFEDLILFSKPKRIEGGFDVYIYKHSIKTADVGLTESCGDSGLRFEIWFRRRKSSDTYTLQASSADTKQAWTADIARILWQQAARNKEIRMQEMVSMGVGNKPFLDIQPSEAAISDRAIDYIMKGRGARTRASIAVSLFDHSKPYQRTQAQLSAGSSPAAYSPSSSSSSSLLGPLNLHMYLDQALLPRVLGPGRPFDAGACIEEDELEHETSSQPSLTTESSGSSHCMSGSGSSGSDSGCVSSVPQESFCDELGPCPEAGFSPLQQAGQVTMSPSTVV